jgi:hypothetical protein
VAVAGCSPPEPEPEGESVARITGALDGDLLIGGDWPQFQRDAAHSGVNPVETAFSPARLAMPLAIAFKAHYSDGAVDEAGPVVADGVLFAADAGAQPDFAGNVSAFAAAGCGGPAGSSCEPLWRGATGGTITTTPAVGGGFVMVASRDAQGAQLPFLFAFDAHGCPSGKCKPVWRGALANADVDSSPAIAGGIAYVGDFAGRFYAFDIAACAAARDQNCPPLWTGQVGANESLVTAPVVGPHVVLVSSSLSDASGNGGLLHAFRVGGCGHLPSVPCDPVWSADIGGPGLGQTLSLTGTVFVSSATFFGDTPDSHFHVLAFAEAGCGAATCTPLRSYDTGDSNVGGGALGTPVVVGDKLLVSSQNTPDLTTIGVVSAYSADGIGNCKKHQCQPLWTGVNFASGFETSPAVAGGVVFVGKNPAAGFQTNGNDAGVYAFDINGCGARQTICQPLSLTQVGLNQFNLGAPLAIARGTIFYSSNDNDDNRTNVYALRP